MKNTITTFSHKLSNSLDLNEFKHITAKQVDQMINSVQPRFKSKQPDSFDNLYPFSKDILLDDVGCMHGPYESDNLVVDTSESAASSDSDDYNDITDLYTDKDMYSAGSISTNPTERTSYFSKDLVALKFGNDDAALRNDKSTSSKVSLDAEHELHKFEKILERNFLKRFDQQMYKEDILFSELNSITGSDVFIKFQYLKNIMELDDNYIESETFTTKDISVELQGKNFIHMNSSLSESFPSSLYLNKFMSKPSAKKCSFKPPSRNVRNKLLASRTKNMEKRDADNDDYIINNDSISSESHNITRRVPTRRSSRPNSILFNVKKSKVPKRGTNIKRNLSKSDKSSAGKSEASTILRQKSHKRAIDALSSKGSSKYRDMDYPTNYKDLKSNVSLLDLYDSDGEGKNKFQKVNIVVEPSSPRLSKIDDEYNPITDALSNIGLEWQPWTNSNSSLDEPEDSHRTDTSLPSFSPNTDTEKSISMASGSQKLSSMSRTASSLKLLPLNKWKSKSKASTENLKISESPILISSVKANKRTDKPLIRQLTEKLIKNKKENEIKDDPLKPILPAEVQHNDLEREFRFSSPDMTTDADDEFNTKSSEMNHNYVIAPKLTYNETSSYYGTQSTAPSFSNTSINEEPQQDNQNNKTLKRRVADKISQIGTISEASVKVDKPPNQSNIDLIKSETSLNKASNFRYNDPYLNLYYDENGIRKSNEDPFR
ncbi:uncharacterized protein HGUI_00217 [Hanseniaspora guilliermondii]|uniref:Uncharacterized protein n=1 Tax=Hanseniaspora guilliermondii TaxID=56406 RepID=A0A1L0CI92_9ASCO|nr:uncharacterized protein HGUI_00217 [Hanseniaspora guilliermondii]